MPAIVAIFQVYENYGSHQWNGKGECPQHWKAKGSSEQIIAEDLSYSEIADMGREGMEALVRERMEETDNEYYQITLIDWEVVYIDSDFINKVEKILESPCILLDDPYLYMDISVELECTEYAAKMALTNLSHLADLDIRSDESYICFANG